MLSLLEDNQSDVIEAFNSTSRYLDDLLNIDNNFFDSRGWSGGAMVLGNFPVPERPTILITVGQGPIALAVGAGGVVWTFLLSAMLSPLSPSLWETA